MEFSVQTKETAEDLIEVGKLVKQKLDERSPEPIKI